MGRHRKTVAELLLSGNARHLTKREIQERIEAEKGPPLRAGVPVRPKGMDMFGLRAWAKISADLSARHVLAENDGPLLQKYVSARSAEVKAKKAGDAEARAKAQASLAAIL